ncbi:fibronectin type III domain-containing protein [Salinibacterium sp. SYSU T00001]|uniref:fibronectin type III domain-containing protein n=1 Tax=Homoserinimonas sedimenticola TaxID=2986805 RepID=UPI00223569D8|nr:fibronectin type III domain-containing protein [Salinibacterium sedimenticola]MCW4385837.1 fibronectin type III domain-containing protein [Salinibacterium sedimenticola]
MQPPRRLAAAFGAALALLLGVAVTPATAAQYSEIGQIVINPGGGNATDGSDGLRIVINSNGTGYDQVYYEGTYQYCCSAGAPSLNIGGTLFGQAYAAAAPENLWDSMTATPVTVEGNTSEVTITANAIVDGLTYSVARHIEYTAPDESFRETFSVTVPEGNTHPVKLYHGGDTAPGSSDSGFGVMLTSPVRTIISLNPSSGIQFGFREVPVGDVGHKAFDGAWSRGYWTASTNVSSGTDLDPAFYVEEAQHDAGLMVQWTIGATHGSGDAAAAGTHVAAMEEFVSRYVNLVGAFSAASAEPNETVDATFTIRSGKREAQSGLGFDLTLPAGMTIAGDASNSCGATVTAELGSGSATVAGASVAGRSEGVDGSCSVTIPVAAATDGTYRLSNANITAPTGELIPTLTERALTVLTAPGTPGTPVVETGDGTATITVTAPSTGGAPDSYTVTALGTSPLATCVAAPASPSCTITGLSNGVAYDFVVTATNPAGESSASAATTATPAGLPAAIETVTVLSGDQRIRATWEAPADNGAAITGYTVSWSSDGGTTWSTDVTTTRTSLWLPRLTNDVAHLVRVSAVNAKGAGVPTVSSPVTPRMIPDTVELAPVPPVTAPPVGESALTVDGETRPVTITRDRATQSVTLEGDGFTMRLDSQTSTGETFDLDEAGNLMLIEEGYLLVEGDGFKPNTDVNLYLFSEPTSLGAVRTDSTGAFSGRVRLPEGIPVGLHTVQAVGMSSDGEIRVLSLGVRVMPQQLQVTGADVMQWLYAGLAAAASGIVLVGIAGLRRRRTA